jgi:hypothetical protein
MKLENQCVSLEIAKRLKELGVKQDSYFHWRRKYNKRIKGKFTLNIGTLQPLLGDKHLAYSAYTVAELGELLPDMIMVFRDEFKRWRCDYKSAQKDRDALIMEDTMADALGEMLIHLIGKGLVK